jgi:hypothetical protein
MPTDLLAELTHEAADSSRRRARYVRAFVASLEAEGPGIDRRKIELTVREAVADSARRGADTGRLWESLFEILRNRPARSSLVKLIAEEVIELTDEWLSLETQIRRLVDVCGKLGFEVGDQIVLQLDDASRAVAKVRSEAETIVTGLNRPRPPIDAARLAQARKSVAEGRALKTEEVIASIRRARQ